MEDEKPVRLTSVHCRFEVSDPVCGSIDHATSLYRAAAVAMAHAAEHSREPNNTLGVVTVYDRMARRGLKREWEYACESCQSAVPFEQPKGGA